MAIEPVDIKFLNRKTLKFDRTLGDIRINKIILAPIRFFEVSALLDVRHYPKLQ